MGRAKKMPKEKRLERTAKRAARRQLISAKRHARRAAKKALREARHPEAEEVAAVAADEQPAGDSEHEE